MGDFNSALNLEDKSIGSSIIDISMRDFKVCVDDIVVSEVNRAGIQFTWNQKPKGEYGIHKKIYRVMANLEFNGTLALMLYSNHIVYRTILRLFFESPKEL